MKDKSADKHLIESDEIASSRKTDHLEYAFKSVVPADEVDARFNYEPALAGHLTPNEGFSTNFLSKTMKYPIWVSSMTGGTESAGQINKNLAKACGQFGLGMGLGSCRQLLSDKSRFKEFDVRQYMSDQPLMINLGIAQIERMLEEKEEQKIEVLISDLQADGLIVHINPLQEWMQPEGDRYINAPIQTINKLLERVDYPIIVKEVGQGFGKESIKQLLGLPLAALDLAGFGGTNFSKLELLRSDQMRFDAFERVFNLGHTCEEMMENINSFVSMNEASIKCKSIIFSGGIKNFLDGYYFISKSKLNAIYAQASGFLKYAHDYDSLVEYISLQTEGLKMSQQFLTIKE